MFYEPLPGCITSNVRFSNSLERHETWVRYTHVAIQPNRTKTKKYSNWKKSNVKSECFKKNLWDQVRMFYFRTSSIELVVIERSRTLYRKTRVEQNRPVDQALKQPRRFEVLFLSYIGTCMQPCIKRPVFKVPILAHTNAVFVTCIRRPPLLRGR